MFRTQPRPARIADGFFTRVLASLLLAALLNCLAANPSLADRQSDWRDCQSQDLDVNIDACSRILLDPGSSETDRKQALRLRGFAFLSQNSVISADHDFSDLVKLEPGNVTALAGRSMARFRRGEVDEAILDYSFARRLDSATVDAMVRTNEVLKDVETEAQRKPSAQALLDELQRGLIKCNAGTRQQGLACVPIACPAGQRLDGNNCVAIVCPQGRRLQGSDCVAISCPIGERLDGNNCVAIVCQWGQRLQGSDCVAISCPVGQRLDGNSCVAIVCGQDQRLQGSVCVDVQPPRNLPLPLLTAASGARWCTLRRTYSLQVVGDKIVWTDDLGSVDVERIVSNQESSARTITERSQHTRGEPVSPGTVWTYRADGGRRISVSKGGGASFMLTRC
jgi:hypothetical protein